MGIFQTSIGGPLALNAHSAENSGSGPFMRLHQSTYVRGEVVQYLNPALASITGVEVGRLEDPSGTLMNAGLLVDEDDGFAGIVNSPNPVPTGQEGNVVVDGACLASVFLEDDGNGDSIAVNEGDPVYLVGGQKYLSASGAVANSGRKCGVVLETLAAGARPVDEASLLRVYFTGIPPHVR